MKKKSLFLAMGLVMGIALPVWADSTSLGPIGDAGGKPAIQAPTLGPGYTVHDSTTSEAGKVEVDLDRAYARCVKDGLDAAGNRVKNAYWERSFGVCLPMRNVVSCEGHEAEAEACSANPNMFWNATLCQCDVMTVIHPTCTCPSSGGDSDGNGGCGCSGTNSHGGDNCGNHD